MLICVCTACANDIRYLYYKLYASQNLPLQLEKKTKNPKKFSEMTSLITLAWTFCVLSFMILKWHPWHLSNHAQDLLDVRSSFPKNICVYDLVWSEKEKNHSTSRLKNMTSLQLNLCTFVIICSFGILYVSALIPFIFAELR